MLTRTSQEEQTIKVVRRLVGENNLNAISNIGSYSELYATHQPQTVGEFAQVVKDYGKKPLSQVLEQLVPISDRERTGLTREQLTFGLKQFLLIDTFNGLHKERVAIQKLGEVFPDLSIYQDCDLDTSYAVDVFIEGSVKTGSNPLMVLGIQVKPESYRTRNPTVIHQKNILLDKEKNRKFEARYDAPVFYLYYDGRTNSFTNWDDLIQKVTLSYSDKVIKTKLLGQKTGIDFLQDDDDTLDDADLDVLIQLLIGKKKQRKA